MKLIAILLITTIMQVSAVGVSAQNVTLKQTNARLTTVLDQIRKQTGYDFLYSQDMMENARPVNLDITKLNVSQALEICFLGQPLTYTIENKIVTIREKEHSVLENLRAYFLVYTLQGKVLDEDGKPLIGANVSILGMDKGTRTDESGDFSLANIVGDETLITRYIGYKSDTLRLRGQKNITVQLKFSASTLTEVDIVSTGYEQLNKERATGSFGVVSAKQLSQFPVVSVLERLQGLVPGVNISTKTTAGKSRNGTVNIRGISTLVSKYTKVSTDPLLVIDGFPSQRSITDGAFDFINPDDIEQVTFLKDAAAASIWGIQAANGVIVITTKKGMRNSKPIFNFSTTLGTSKRPRADYGTMMSMTNYIALEKELIDRGIIPSDPVLSTPSPDVNNNSQAQAIIFAAKRGAITNVQRDEQLAALAANDNSDQVSRLLLQPPTTRQYNLSVSGGGINNSYFVSGYFYSEDRVYKSNLNKGYSINANNVSTLMNGRVTITTGLTIGNTKDKVNSAAVRAMSITSGGLRPYDMLEDANGNLIHYDVLTIPSFARTLESKGYLPFGYSPVEELQYSNTLNTANNIAMNLAVNGKLTSWLGVNVSGNLGRYFSENETYLEPNSYEARMMVNRGTSLSTSGARTYGVPIGGRLDLDNSLGRTYSVRGQMTVNKNWKQKHQLNLLAGSEIRELFSKSSGEQRYGYDKTINSFRTVGGSYRDMYGLSQSIGATTRPVTERTTRALSYYANGSYSFDNKYTVSGSVRLDDHNLLGVERRKRAIPLWSAGLKWNVKNEQFMKNIPWVNQLGIRATYGFSGNAPQGYAPVAVINLLGNNFYTGYPSGIIETPAIDNLSWEKTRMINYGMDFSLFKNRFFGSVEYYKKHTTDIIWAMDINATYGYSNTLFNTANLEGKGVDVGLNVVPIMSKDFKLTSTLNVSYNTNLVSDVRFDLPKSSLLPENLYDGYPSDYLFSYAWAGLDNTGQSRIYDANVPGKIYNVMEFALNEARVYSGRTNSPWFGSFGNTFQYKQWELNVQFMYVLGGVFRKPSVVSVGFSNDINVGRSGDLDQRWKAPGDENKTNVPGLIYGPNTNFYQSLLWYTESDYLVRSRSNVRLQQIMLSYSLPPKLLNKVGIKGLTLSASCRNLGMIWAANKEGYDPDYLYTTGNNYQLAPVPSFSFRTGLSF